jgi:hypothetical protein
MNRTGKGKTTTEPNGHGHQTYPVSFCLFVIPEKFKLNYEIPVQMEIHETVLFQQIANSNHLGGE